MAGFKKIAHRGASGHYPENTRLAFTKAIQAGADMIELDCQLSRDGHVVVFHDEQLQRTAGVRGTLHSKTLAQLKSRSEEHTSELQSLAYLVCRLLLEKKKK